MEEEESKTTDEHVFKMKYRNFVMMMFSLIIGTNTGTGLIFNQEQNTIQIEYNKERDDRKHKQQEEDYQKAIYINNLEQELKYCKEDILKIKPCQKL